MNGVVGSRRLSGLSVGLEPVRAVMQLGPYLMDQAREVRRFAVHYDGFHVGATAIALSQDGDLHFLWGANQNLFKGPNPTRICAEKRIMDKATDQGLGKIIAFFTSGPPQADSHSGRIADTLHSCGTCRGDMKASPLVEADSLLVTVHPEHDLYELYTFDEYLGIHEAKDGHLPLPFVHQEDPDFKRWLDAQAVFDRYTAGSYQPETDFSQIQLARLAITGFLK